MPSELKKERKQDTVDLNEMAKYIAPKEDVISRIEEGKRLEGLRLEAARHRRQTTLVIVVGLLLLFAGGGFLVYKQFSGQPTGLLSQGGTNSNSTPGTTVGEKKVEVTSDYTLTKMTLNTPDFGPVELYTYDFYANKFLKDQEGLSDPESLVKVFRDFRDQESLRTRIEKSWVLIFAGASSEGTENHNLELSSRRVNGVFQMMTKDAGLSPLGYWAIRAGEYKGFDEKMPSDKAQARSLSTLSPEEKENLLGPQRRLIVFVITPPRIPPQAEYNKDMTYFAGELYKQDLDLHIDGYHHTLAQRRTDPVPIAVTAPVAPPSGSTPGQSK